MLLISSQQASWALVPAFCTANIQIHFSYRDNKFSGKTLNYSAIPPSVNPVIGNKFIERQRKELGEIQCIEKDANSL